MRRRKKKFNIVKAMRKVKRMIKLGIILAIIFLILCLLLWLWDLFQNGGGPDFFPVPKRHYNDVTNSLQLLQEEVELLKMKNSILETEVQVNQAMILHQNELINDIQESLNNSVWNPDGVTYHYQVSEITEGYQVLEFEEVEAKSFAPKTDPSLIMGSKLDIPIMIGVGITVIKGLLWSRGIPAF